MNDDPWTMIDDDDFRGFCLNKKRLFKSIKDLHQCSLFAILYMYPTHGVLGQCS